MLTHLTRIVDMSTTCALDTKERRTRRRAGGGGDSSSNTNDNKSSRSSRSNRNNNNNSNNSKSTLLPGDGVPTKHWKMTGVQSLSAESDYKIWYEVMARNPLCELPLGKQFITIVS